MQIATHRLPGLILTDHRFDLPVDHTEPDGPKIAVVARELVAPAKESADLPMLVFLQGGPW